MEDSKRVLSAIEAIIDDPNAMKRLLNVIAEKIEPFLVEAELMPDDMGACSGNITSGWERDEHGLYRKVLDYNHVRFLQACSSICDYAIVDVTIDLRDYTQSELENEVSPCSLKEDDFSRISVRADVAQSIFKNHRQEYLQKNTYGFYKSYDDAAFEVCRIIGETYVPFEDDYYRVEMTSYTSAIIYNKTDHDICLRMDSTIAQEASIKNDIIILKGGCVEFCGCHYEDETRYAINYGNYYPIPLDETGYAFNVGDTVIVANPDSPYMGMVGRVTDIHILGTEEHDMKNETDDIVVDFSDYLVRRAVMSPKWLRKM